jgi:hypothetical protein
MTDDPDDSARQDEVARKLLAAASKRRAQLGSETEKHPDGA